MSPSHGDLDECQPSQNDFSSVYNTGMAQVAWLKTLNDTDTPVSAYLKLAASEKNAFLLESVEGGENLGRYSIIGLRPDAIWSVADGEAKIRHCTNDKWSDDTSDDRPVLDSLKAFLTSSEIDLPLEVSKALPPMFAGVFGYFGYEFIHYAENIPANTDNDLGLHESIMIRPTMLVVFDNLYREVTFITPVRPVEGIDSETAYAQARTRLEDVRSALTAASHDVKEPANPTEMGFSSNKTEREFGDMVARAKEYIRAGDIFQVVLSQRFSSAFTADPFAFYRALRRLNPSPFLFFLNFENCAIVGSSPEILVRVRDGDVTIRPIAGTRPRGDTTETDLGLEKDLLADPKELAEHLMLLDLGRNDVGRVAEIGSVNVTEKFTIERYSHVMHIVSNVTGKLADGIHPVDALLAGFPAGTVSGAPKIRAMEIISELEPDQRGPYAGCIGYFSADGSVDTCIALRTAVIKDEVIHVQAGAGIVADSDSYSEFLECHNKARALKAAAELAYKIR